MGNVDPPHADYAKVLFCDLFRRPLGCRFEITDSVHEDPWDRIGLFRVGQGRPKQCLSSKRLCETTCEEDGKRLRCTFQAEELPELEDGFYQFLYITRDDEVCGASTPFEIKGEGDSSEDDVVAEDDGDFLVVHSEKERKWKNEREEKEKLLRQKENLIEHLDQELETLSRELKLEKNKSTLTNETILKLRRELKDKSKTSGSLLAAKNKLSDDKEQLQKILKKKEHIIAVEIPTLLQDKQLLLQQLEDSQTMIKALEDSKRLALKEMNDLAKVLEHQNDVLDEIKIENETLKKNLDKEMLVIQANTSEISQLEGDYKDLMKKYEEKDAKISQLNTELEDSRKQFEEKTNEILKLEAALADSVKKCDEKSAEISNLEGVLQHSVKKYDELMEELQSLKNAPARNNVETNECYKIYQEIEKKHIKLSMNLDDYASKNLKDKKLVQNLKCERLANLLQLEEAVTNSIKKTNEVKYLKADLKDSIDALKEKTTEVFKLKECLEELRIEVQEKDAKISQLNADFNSRKRFEEEEERRCERKTHQDVSQSPIGPAAQGGCFKIAEPHQKVDVLNLAELINPFRFLNEEIPRLQRKSLVVKGSEDNVGANQAKEDEESKLLVINEVQTANVACIPEEKEAFVDKDEKIAIQERIIEELKCLVSSLVQGNTELEMDESMLEKNLSAEDSSQKLKCNIIQEALQKKNQEIEKMADKTCNLQSSCEQLNDMVADLKSHCADLRSAIEEKDTVISKLKENFLKKEAVIEYLTEEKSEMQKSHRSLYELMLDLNNRLKDAAELYKKQYIEIKRLKKKLQKSREHAESAETISKASSTMSESFSEERFTFAPTYQDIYVAAKPFTRTSDSDTGERVLATVTKSKTKEESSTISDSYLQHLYPSLDVEEHPQMEDKLATIQLMIDQNLADFQSSEKVAFPEKPKAFVPCSMCGDMFLSDGLLEHMEQVHTQKMCPMCGKLFDMNLPHKYLLFHVEDHFRGMN